MSDTSPNGASQGGRSTKAATDEVLLMLAENMRQMEDMEEEKIRLQREHELERERLEARMEEIVDQFLEQKRELEHKMAEEEEEMMRRLEEEKQAARREAEAFRKECEQKLAEEKAMMDNRVAEFRAEREKLESEKTELTRSMEAFRSECEANMAKAKEEMAQRSAEFQAECTEQMKQKEAETAKLQAENERKMAEEKAEMARKTAEFHAELDRMAAEKAEEVRKLEEFRAAAEKEMMQEKSVMTREMNEFRTECEKLENEKRETNQKVLQLRAEAEQKLDEQRKIMAEEQAAFQAQCERMDADHRAEMERHAEEFQRERERLAEQQKEMEKQMADFQLECANKMKEEELEMARKQEQYRKESERKMEEIALQLEIQRQNLEERMREEQEVARLEMVHFREVCEREMLEEKQEMGARMDKLQLESARLEQEKAEMLKAMEGVREEYQQVAREKEDMAQRVKDFQAECEQQIHQKELEVAQRTREMQADAERQIAEEKAAAETELAAMRRRSEEMFRAECERLAEEQAQMTNSFTAFREECERQMAEEKADMEKKTAGYYEECSKKIGRNEALMKQRTSEFLAEREKMTEEKDQLRKEMEDFRVECDKKMQAEDLAMKRKAAELRSDFEKKIDQEKRLMETKIAENEAQMAKRSAEMDVERKRIAEEKAEMIRQMDIFRMECERKLLAEEREMNRKTAEFRAECDKQVAEQKAAAERRLEEAREQTEKQLRMEREVTEHIKVVLRELPPLQTAMELGDLALLEEELWKWRAEVLPERFGDCKGVVEAVVKLAKERLLTWRNVDVTWKEILREVESLPGSSATLTQQCQRLFRALKEAQLTRMDLRRSDPRAMEKACQVLLAWQARTMAHSNVVHELIIQKVVNWPSLGTFDFTDLDICLRLVDRRESDSQIFLSRVRALVEDENTAPKDLRSLLSHVETMLFFLKYAKSEDLQQTHLEFRKQFPNLDPVVVGFLQAAERDYPRGGELVCLSDDRNLLNGTDVSTVLKEIRSPKAGLSGKGLGLFREIFYQWALAMQSKFNLLVLPHHTQVVCLLAFRHFLEAAAPRQAAGGPGQQLQAAVAQTQALIAQVGTGEGKSMIIAALAIYVVVAIGKKVHVVVDDETLLERDFHTFRPLFDAFVVPSQNGASPTERRLSAVLCVSEERLAAAGGGEAKGLAARVDPEADICYCEAKHVQSFYTSIARSEKADFSTYKDRVLILDEVDALVIDEEPNEAFVYPNPELSGMATAVADSLKKGATPQDLASRHSSTHPAARRVINMLQQEWDRAKTMVSGEDFVYGKELGKYCALQGGRANPKAWSLALECRNFQDGFTREIFFQERLFVMSRPRVFRKYFRILGLSGSIGSSPERKFLQETYRAAFFEVPPFLKTCRGAPFHEAVPAPLGEKKQAFYVESSAELQMARVAEVALEARERVPVLVIAKDRGHADQLVENLQQVARSHGLGRVAPDMVRSLSRTLFESDPEQWKENLNRATMPLGDREEGGGNKSWRITVTDPRGARGTDYRVDDSDVDGCGGLLLVPTVVPQSQRDWVQYLGRTARQDRRGQYCPVLCSVDYTALSTKYGGKLETGSLDGIKTILSWGDRDTAARIQASAALYNNGVRMNELCEDIFGAKKDVIKDPAAREFLVDTCQRHRFMSIREVDQAFSRIPGVEPARVPTEARDMGRPAEPPTSAQPAAPRMRSVGSVYLPQQGSVFMPQGGAQATQMATTTRDVPKVVIFCLDWSASMMSRDTKTPMTRFELCVRSIRQLLQNQVRDSDLVGVVCFGPQVTVVVPPVPKGANIQVVEAKIAGLRPQSAGGTCFYDAVTQCLQLLGKPQVDPQAPRWLICLTDGDDLGSRRENAAGQLVSGLLQSGGPPNLNMIMITVGPMRPANLRIIDSWVNRVKTTGGHGQLISQRDAGQISMAFQVVAECLAGEVGGATEC